MMMNNHISKSIGDELIVAGEGTQRVFVLNAPARFVWESMAAGVVESQMPQKMVEHFGIELARADQDLSLILNDWRREGILPPEAPCHQYQLAGITVSVYFLSASARDVVVPLFRHLEIRAIDRNIDFQQVNMEICDTANGFSVVCNGSHLGNPKTIDELLEIFTIRFVDIVHDRADKPISLHAAAIGDASGCILMPGQSGSGKSTITAAFVAAGYQYYSDDTVLLNDEFKAVPLPSPLVLKGRKWPMLASILPDIEQLPIYQRLGTDVRYWSPPPQNIAQNEMPVRAIVFPTFKKDSAFQIEALTPAQTLTRIVSANCMIRRAISNKLLDDLICWLEQVPSFAMTHNNFSRSMEFVKKQMSL